MRTMRRVVVMLVALAAVACVDIEVQRIGPDRPSRPPGCAVELLPDAKPAYEFVDVATGTVSCARERGKCLDELRKQACIVGADAVYGFSESAESMYTHITARFAARKL